MTTCVLRRTVYSLVLGLNPDCFDGKDWETYPDCFDGKAWERYTYSGLNTDCFDGKDCEIYIYSGLNPDCFDGKDWREKNICLRQLTVFTDVG